MRMSQANSANTKLGCHNVARLRNYVCKSKKFRLRILALYQDYQQRDCVRIYFESLTILKVRILPRMSQMNKTLRTLRVATTLALT